MSTNVNQPTAPAAPRPTLARRIGRTALAATLGIVSFGALAFAGLSASTAAEPLAPSPTSTDQPPAPTKGARVVAIILGRSGSDTADVFAPYEVFSSSPSFSVYTVADTHEPAPMDGGLSVVPSYTFAELAAGRAPKPDLIVVPAVNDPFGPSEEAARTFLADYYSEGGPVLGVCAGSRLLAASGVLDGLRATSHWSRISALESSNPAVTWERGQRYLQDGRVTTTGGVTSSIAGSLKVMADLAGPAEAIRVGNLINYPGWSLDGPTAMPAQSFAVGDLAVLANAAFPWGRPSIDIQLKDGIDEIDAAALFEVYNYSQAAAVRAVSESGIVTMRHGLVIRTATGSSDQAALVPGAVESYGGLHGFDPAFEQLSRTTSPAGSLLWPRCSSTR